MTRLRRLTGTQWAVVLAVTVLAAAGITVAALTAGGPSRPAVKLQLTNPSPGPSGPATPAVTTPAASQPAPVSPTVVTPPPRAYTVSPRPPAQAAGPGPSQPGAGEVTRCPLNMKCTLPCPDLGTCTPSPACPPNAMCAQPAVGDALVLTDADNGRTVTIAPGGRVVVQLGSTYWTFDAPSNPSVLAAQGAQQTASCPVKGLPGSGCGTATVTYAAAASGTAVVSAQRTTCGEAMLCPSGQGSFRVTVVVG